MYLFTGTFTVIVWKIILDDTANSAHTVIQKTILPFVATGVDAGKQTLFICVQNYTQSYYSAMRTLVPNPIIVPLNDLNEIDSL